MKRVLSIDGGGIRGIIPAVLLARMESLTGIPCAKQFDFMVGTSTGGILAALLACSYTAEKAGELYTKEGSLIFSRSRVQFVLDHFNIVNSRYGAWNIEAVLKEYFGYTPLTAAATKLMVPSFDLDRRDMRFWKSWKSAGELMWEAARATSAAPTFFPPFNRQVDGGVGCNDPAISAYAEALQLWPGEEIRLLSIGTGSHDEGAITSHLWGDAAWANKITGVLLDASMNMVEYQATRLIPGDCYMRIQPHLGNVPSAIDNADAEHLARLQGVAKGCFQCVDQAITFLNQPSAEYRRYMADGASAGEDPASTAARLASQGIT